MSYVCGKCGAEQEAPDTDVACRSCGEVALRRPPKPRGPTAHEKQIAVVARYAKEGKTEAARRFAQFLLDQDWTVSEFVRDWNAKVKQHKRGRLARSTVLRWLSGDHPPSRPRARRIAEMMRARGYVMDEIAQFYVDILWTKSQKKRRAQWWRWP